MNKLLQREKTFRRCNSLSCFSGIDRFLRS